MVVFLRPCRNKNWMEPSPFHLDLPFLFLNFPCYMWLHPDFKKSFSVFMVKEQELMIMLYIDYYRWLMMVAYHQSLLLISLFFGGFLHRPSPLAPTHRCHQHLIIIIQRSGSSSGLFFGVSFGLAWAWLLGRRDNSIIPLIPSGKRLHNYGKIHHFDISHDINLDNFHG